MKFIFLFLSILVSNSVFSAPRVYKVINVDSWNNEISYVVDGKSIVPTPYKEQELVQALSHSPQSTVHMTEYQRLLRRGLWITGSGALVLITSLISLNGDNQTTGLAVGGLISAFGASDTKKAEYHLNEAINLNNGVKSETHSLNATSDLKLNWAWTF